MKQLNRFIYEQCIKEGQEHWWKSSDFDDREVNYYCVEWTHEYNSLAGPQKEDNRVIFIIWDKENLSESELNKFIKKHCVHLEKKDKSTLNDYKEVKHGTLKELLKLCEDINRKNYWVGDIVDTKIDESIYWCFT